MATRTAGISAKLNLNTKDWFAGIRKAESDFKGFAGRIKNSPALNLKTPGLGNLSGLRTGYTELNAKVGLVRSTVNDLNHILNKPLSANAKYADIKDRISSLTKSAEEASSHMGFLGALAERQDMPLATLAQASERMLSLGHSVRETETFMTELANAMEHFGGNADMLLDVVSALDKIDQKGKASTKSLIALTESLPALRSVMQDAFGARTAADMEKLNLTSRELMEGMQAGLRGLDNAEPSWFERGLAGSALHKAGVSSDTDRLFGADSEDSRALPEREAHKETAAERSERLAAIKARKAGEAAEKDIVRRKAINALLTEKNDEDRQQYDLAIAAANEDQEEVDRLTEAIRLEKEITDIRQKHKTLDQDQLDAMAKAADLRRQDAKAIREANAATANTRERRSLDIAKDRHMGRNRRADKKEDADAVAELVKGGAKQKDAEALVRERRDFADDEKLGPGRRRLRQLPKTPETSALPERGNVTLPPADILPGRAPMPDTTPRPLPRKPNAAEEAREAVRRGARGADAATGGQAPGSDAILKEINGNMKALISATQDNAKTPAQRVAPARST